eukprot:scaffold27514_cov69-Cyclotella_meneghiniana.AAC.3
MSPQTFPTTNRPSKSPSQKPSPKPTVTPTESPTGKPSGSPSMNPTVVVLTNTPSQLPSANPIVTPTSLQPTLLPTETPSKNPTYAPSIDETSVPTVLTASPSVPSKSTQPTTKLLGPTSVTNLKITLSGIDGLPNTNQWARKTASYFQDWYNRSSKDPLSVQYNIYDAQVKITYESETESGARRFLRSLLGGKRKLQSSSSVEVTYTQSTMYRTRDSSIDVYDIVESPLEQQADRDVYVKTLKDMDGYEGLTDVSTVSVPGDDANEIIDGSEETGGLSTGAIIGIACGSVAGAILLGGLIFVSSRSDKESEAEDRSTQDP